MSDFASLLRFAQQTSQTPRLDINPAAGLGAGSVSQAYRTLHPEPATPLFQPQTLPLPPPQMTTFQPLASDDPHFFQGQMLPETAAPFQSAGAGKGGPIVKGAGPSAGSGSVTSALARLGMFGG